MERGGRKIGSPAVEIIARNIVRSTLAAKAKIMFTRALSITNGLADRPFGVSNNSKLLIEYYNPIKWIEGWNHLKKHSEFVQARYDVGGVENAVLGLSQLANKPSFRFDYMPNLEAKRRAAARFYKSAIDKALINVKWGDAIGLSGGVPVYLAWKDVYMSRGMSESEADQAAIQKFEAVVDRTQQSNTFFGKSEFQNNPVWRYFAMYQTAPIQNFNNANYHMQELLRGIKAAHNKQPIKSRMKGTLLQNAIGLINFGIIQPSAYVYLSFLGAAKVMTFFQRDDEDEAPGEADKELMKAFVAGNFEAIPITGSIIEFLVDKIVLDKDKSFGGGINSALIDEVEVIFDTWQRAMQAKSPETREENMRKVYTKLAGIFSGAPQLLTDLALNWDDVYNNDAISSASKTKLLLGWSRYVLAVSKEERPTWKEVRDKAKADLEKWEKRRKEWENTGKEIEYQSNKEIYDKIK